MEFYGKNMYISCVTGGIMKKSEAYDWLSIFANENDLTFEDCYYGYQNFDKALDEYPDLSRYVLSAVRSSLRAKGFNSDTMPGAVKCFCKAAKNVEEHKLKEEYEQALSFNDVFAMRCIPGLLETYPELANYFFDKILENIERCDANHMHVYGTAAVKSILVTNNNVDGMLKRAMDNEKINKTIYENAYEIYNVHPELEQMLMTFLKSNLTSKNYNHFYQNLAYMGICNLGADENTVYIDDSRPIDETMPEKCLVLMEEHVTDESQNCNALAELYRSAGRMLKIFPKYEMRIKALINKGLEHPNNSKISQKVAYETLGEHEKLRSKITVYKRRETSDECPYGIERVEKLDSHKPRVLVLGGDAVRYERQLNGYLGEIYRLMEAHGLQDQVNIYGVVYDFGEYMDVNWSRTKMMHDYHRDVGDKELNEETKDPKYIKDIFNDFIEPCLCDNGQRFSDKQAVENIRKLQIFAHCHGAYTALKLEEMMQARMEELKYSAESREYIQKQLLIVSQSPYCPLGVSKSTMISFASAWDMEIDHCNLFEKSMRSIIEAENIPLCYFPDERGNLFLTDRMGYGCDDHNFFGFVPSSMHSEDASKMLVMEGNALINGVKNALESTGELGTVKDLVSGEGQEAQWFDEAYENGIKLYNKMYAIAMGVAKYRSDHKKR